MRILALDWGTVRVGAAISDENQTIAFPLKTFIKRAEALDEISKLIKEEKVGRLLIGLPKSLSGQQTAATLEARKFIEKLRTGLNLPIDIIDERLSSKGSAKILKDQGLSEKQGRLVIDNIVAQQMLQQYLDTAYKH